jgi:hypothetical protein
MYVVARTDPRIRMRVLVFLSAGFATVVFHTLWPLITRQNMLPLIPVLALYATAWLWPRGAWRDRRDTGRLASTVVRVAVSGLAVLFSFADIIRSHPPWQNQADADSAVRALVLSLTPQDGYVMDAKGEAVFRQRPIYPVLETITLRQYARGLLEDDIPERLAATGTAVVIPDRVAFDAATLTFLRRNYLDLAQDLEEAPHHGSDDRQGLPRLMVAGLVLTPPAAGGSVEFAIEVPTRYAVLAGDRAQVRIDGADCRGSIPLAAGTHRLSAGPGSAAVTLVYAPVVALGLAPRPLRHWAA